ncbi:DNA/RNA helicase domain-containing protein [Enterococcus faecium]|uniref:GIY-YIG nuclease family protein n=1 Tax=Enterococcus faecium TaxID=1352 RepID=UPI003D31514A
MSELVFEKRDFNTEQILALKASRLDNNPIVYILYNEKKKPTAYIGQTVQAARRLKNHLRDKKRISLTRTIFIGHERFHQSASYNIETNLINYFIAENHYQLQNVSQTRSREMHHYYQKEFYNEHLFEEIWNQLRKENVVSDTLENLRNKDIYKLSPYKELSPQQVEIKNEILDFCKAHIEKPGNHVISIEGDAGTGKSVLLSSLFNTIQDLSKDENSHLKNKNNYLLVNHGEMLKTYKSIANSLPNLKKKKLNEAYLLYKSNVKNRGNS